MENIANENVLTTKRLLIETSIQQSEPVVMRDKGRCF